MFGHVAEELRAMSHRWMRGTGEGPELVREAVKGLVAANAANGPMMRALADAAPSRQAMADTLTTIWTRVLYGE